MDALVEGEALELGDTLEDCDAEGDFDADELDDGDVDADGDEDADGLKVSIDIRTSQPPMLLADWLIVNVGEIEVPFTSWFFSHIAIPQ